jgi:hypothetical protein
LGDVVSRAKAGVSSGTESGGQKGRYEILDVTVPFTQAYVINRRDCRVGIQTTVPTLAIEEEMVSVLAGSNREGTSATWWLPGRLLSGLS